MKLFVYLISVVEDVNGLSGKVKMIYDSLPESWPEQSELNPLAGDEILFLYVGNYFPGKGQDYALRAFEIASKTEPQIRLRFAGNTHSIPKNIKFLKELKQLVDKKGLGDKVEFTRQSIDVHSEMYACDVVLNFSESESFSMVCLEALFCKKPVISTRSGGPEEIIRHEVNGLLVKNRDVNDMAKAMLKLASSPYHRNTFAKNADIDFNDKFNISSLAEELFDAYSGEVVID